jgi:hypothetical protein
MVAAEIFNPSNGDLPIKWPPMAVLQKCGRSQK